MWMGPGTEQEREEWSREHAQINNFAFPLESFPVRLVLEKILIEFNVSRTLNGESYDNQSNQIIIANAALNNCF